MTLNFAESFRKADTLEEITEKNLVQYTGLMTAAMRMVESKRSDRIMNDPFAEKLAGSMGTQFLFVLKKLIPEDLHSAWNNVLAVRTRYLDEFMNSQTKVRQVVVLAGGLDSRSYRLDTLKNANVFELDMSPWFTKKKQLLSEYTPVARSHQTIECDLCSDHWGSTLIEKGFDPKTPTLWTLEGLLYYLERGQSLKILREIDHLSAQGSCFWADHFGDNAITSQIPVFSSFKDGTNDPLNDLFSIGGWTARVSANLSVPGEHFGRAWEPFATLGREPIAFHFVEGQKGSL